MARIGMKSVRMLSILIVVALCVSAVPMITGKDNVTNAAAAVHDGYVRIGWVSEVVNWNPLLIEMVEDYVTSFLLYSCLFTYDENWGGPINDLATGWYQEVDPVDNSMITYINITHNSYFNSASDLTGKTHQLTAEDVEFTFNLIKSEEGYTYDWYFTEITVLGTANATGTGAFQDQIQLYTEYPKATLIDDITSVPILPMYLWEGYSNPFAGMQPTQLVGSGPFVFEDWLKGGWYKFKTAPNYHGSLTHPGEDRTVDVNGLLYTLYGGGDPLCVAVNEGIEDVVAITGYTQAFLNILGKQANVNVIKAAVQEPGICDIAINAIPPEFYDHEGGSFGTGNPVLLDPYVRQAIMMTLNKTFIVDSLLHGLAVRGSSVVQPGYWQADIEELDFDPAAARQLLIDHGWSADSDGDGFLEATSSAWGVQKGYVTAGTELSGIRCQAPDTDKTYEYVALSWKGEAAKAGIQFDPCGAESEMTMINQAWYNCDYDIWVWHWGWGPEPIGGALTVWLTELIKKGGDNCQMPMGEWWYGWENWTEAPTTWSGLGETIEYTLDGPYSSFDQNISIAMTTLDPAERKAILDPLQQVIYDSYCENPPFYDLGLYGYSDYNFEGWGDWRAHNGLNIASGLNWLWYSLEIVENRAPIYNTPPQDYYTAIADMDTEFSVQVSDAEGDPITVEFSFGDGATETKTVDGAADQIFTVTVSHEYSTTADLTMYINLTDNFEDRIPDSRMAVVEVQGEVNLSPEIVDVTHDPAPPVYVGTEVEWTATGTDAESGTYGLKFTWDWNDGTFDVDDVGTVPDGEEVTSTQTHTWEASGDYVVKIYLYDGYGTESNGDRNISVPIPFTVVAQQAPAIPQIEAINGLIDVPTLCRATSSDSDGDPITFTWEWDDGSYTVEELTPSAPDAIVTSSVSHTWDTADTYPVTVYADDGDDGHNVSATVDAVIAASGNVPPGAFGVSFTPSPLYVGVITTFNFSAFDANEDALTFTIDFGDDSDPVELTTLGGTIDFQYNETTHTYDEEGSYTIAVEYSDGTETVETAILVSAIIPTGNLPPTFALNSVYSALYGVERSYQPVSISDPEDDELTVWYNWGDGSPMTMGDPDTDYSANHTYWAKTNHTMFLYADDGEGNNVSHNATVNVLEGNYRPSIILTVEPVLAANEKYDTGQELWINVSVGDFEGDDIDLVIDFGDGTEETMTVEVVAKILTNLSFTHSYDESGVYDVNATVDDGMLHSDPTIRYSSVAIEVEDQGGSSVILLIAAAALALIIILAVVMMMMRRKKKGPEVGAEGGMEGMATPVDEPAPPLDE